MKRRISLVAACAALAGLLLGPVDTAGAHPGDMAHLPDLVTRKPSDLKIRYENGRRLLRFSNTVWNPGPGRLILHPHNDGGTTSAYQHLHNGYGTFVDERLAGTFDFHQGHNHWHFEDFAVYELLNTDGTLIGGRLRVSEKTTFCIMDTGQFSTSVEHADLVSQFSDCDGPNTTQGLSVGWGDTYGWYLDGQWVEVDGVPDGDYLLRSTADRENRIQEAKEDNNVYEARIRIRRNNVRMLK